MAVPTLHPSADSLREARRGTTTPGRWRGSRAAASQHAPALTRRSVRLLRQQHGTKCPAPCGNRAPDAREPPQWFHSTKTAPCPTLCRVGRSRAGDPARGTGVRALRPRHSVPCGRCGRAPVPAWAEARARERQQRGKSRNATRAPEQGEAETRGSTQGRSARPRPTSRTQGRSSSPPVLRRCAPVGQPLEDFAHVALDLDALPVLPLTAPTPDLLTRPHRLVARPAPARPLGPRPLACTHARPPLSTCSAAQHVGP